MILYTHRMQGPKAPKCPSGACGTARELAVLLSQVPAIKGKLPRVATLVFTLARWTTATVLPSDTQPRWRARRMRPKPVMEIYLGAGRSPRWHNLGSRRRVTPHPETIPSSLAHESAFGRATGTDGRVYLRSGYLRVGLTHPVLL